MTIDLQNIQVVKHFISFCFIIFQENKEQMKLRREAAIQKAQEKAQSEKEEIQKTKRESGKFALGEQMKVWNY